MSDNTNDDPLDNPIIPQAESTTEKQTENIAPNRETENMEVHHHTHPAHGKKTWKDYFWEFLMLFLAVFCGFLAEYQLEQTIERHREKEYIQSFIQDLKQDTAQMRIRINHIRACDKGLDSLLELARVDDLSSTRNTKWFYYYYFRYGPIINRLNSNDGTMQQLKNAGGLRLIRNVRVVDSIMYYDNFNKGMERQAEAHQRHVRDGIDAGDYIFNWALPPMTGESLPATVFLSNDSLPALKPDKERLNLFLNKIAKQKATALFYKQQLEGQFQYAARLIPYLRKQYNLNDNED